MAIHRRRPLKGSSNAGAVGKNRDFRRTSGYRIDKCWNAINSCDGRQCSCLLCKLEWTSVYHTDRHSSAELVYHSRHGRLRRREQNFNCTQWWIWSRSNQYKKIALDVLRQLSYLYSCGRRILPVRAPFSPQTVIVSTIKRLHSTLSSEL